MGTSQQLQLRAGPHATVAAATGAAAEVFYDSDQKRLVANDGATVGGFPHALLSELNKAGAFCVSAAGVNANSIADTALVIPLPSGFTKYRIDRVTALNPSVSLTSAQAAVYTAASAGGVAVASPQALSGLTTNTANTAGNAIDLTQALAAATFFTAATLYFRITTGQGSAATVDVVIRIQPYE